LHASIIGSYLSELEGELSLARTITAVLHVHPPFILGHNHTMATKHWIASVALAGLAALGAYVYWGEASAPAPQSQFVLLDGSSTSTQDLKGKVTLVNFWATSCVTCVAEMPEVIATYNKYKDRGYDTLAVAMQYDPPSYVVNFAQSRQLPFKVALDNTGVIAKDWGDVKLTPTTFIVDKQGQIVKTYVGQPNFEELHQLIEKLLAQA
jgi:peroxiredoxin